MTNYLGKSCSFCLPRVPFVSCRRFMCLVISLFGFEGRIWDLIVSVSDHCLSFYFTLILKDLKENINCTMVDVRGDVLRPPHGTTPAAVKSNKNQK